MEATNVLGIKRRPLQRRKQRSRDADFQELVMQLRAQCLSYIKIADIMKVSWPTIRKVIKSLGDLSEDAPPVFRNRNGVIDSTSLEDSVFKYYIDGLTLQRIADKMGARGSVIVRLVSKNEEPSHPII